MEVKEIKKRKAVKQLCQITFDKKTRRFILSSVESRRINELVLEKAKILLSIIAEQIGIEVEVLLKKNRETKYAHGRFIFYALMHSEFPKLSLADLGSFFAGKKEGEGKDHATVLHGMRTHHNLLEFDKKHQTLVKIIKDIWYNFFQLDEAELRNKFFSFEELLEVLKNNGVQSPHFSKKMFPLKYPEVLQKTVA